MNEKLPISELTPGMILTEDVLRQDGQVLVPVGAVIEERHLRIMDAAGVHEVAAAPPAKEPEEERIDPMVLEAARDYLLKRFKFCDFSLGPVSALFDLCVPRVAAKMVRAKTVFLEDRERPAPGEAFLTPSEAGVVPDPEALLQTDLKLVSLPDVFVRINEVVNNPHSTPGQAADVISKDPSLSVKLLKIVNSAFYGLPSKVDTLSRAVTIVGGRQLTTLALGISVLSLFKDLPPGLIDVRSLWKHCVCCGVVASTLAAEGGSPDAERFFVAGLLHDMGRLVLYKNLPGPASRTLLKAREENILLRDAELDILGWDHAILAGKLLTQWNFPASLERAVRGHHDIEAGDPDLDAAVTHAADVVSNALRIGSSGEFFVPALSPDAWNALGISADVLPLAVARADHQVEEILKAFLPDDWERQA